MSYTPTNWKDGDFITAVKMNKIEQTLQELAEGGNDDRLGGADWEAKEGEDGYIANKPFYDGRELETVCEFEAIFDVDGTYNINPPISIDEKYFNYDNNYILEIGDLVLDGIKYTFEYGYYYFRSLDVSIAIDSNSITSIVNRFGYLGKYNIKLICFKGGEIKKIDKQLLPDGAILKGIKDSKNGVGIEEGYYAIADGINSHAEGGLDYQSKMIYLSGNANANTYSVVEMRFSVHSLVGRYIVASDGEKIRINNEVQDNNGIIVSIELDKTLSDQDITNERFAVFGSNIAYGTNSHAEGVNTIALGEASHAEGADTNASGDNSHAEGYMTISSSLYSHAEGYKTTASGFNSHAEGYSTIANHKGQHVFGEYNIEDASSAYANERGNYVEIVGNGTSSNAKSNARTLDWNGNEVLAGKLTVGANPTDNMDVVTKGYMDARIPVPPTANGTYSLKVTISDGAAAYSWVAE